MRALVLATLIVTGCAHQQLTKEAQRPAVPKAAASATAAAGARGQSRQRATVCSYTIPGQPEFGMTCKEQ